jgi:tetratricopeptide (TPR) repeat protein
VEADPFDALSWFQISVARDKLGDAAGAVEGYARTLDLDSSYAKAHFNLGGVLWNAGARKEAVVAWKEALRRFPTDPVSQKLLVDLPFLAEG